MSLNIDDIDPDVAKNNKKFWAPVSEKYSRYGDEHISASCPKCSKDNWVYIGDPNNIKFCAPEGCECYACKHRFFIGEPWEVKEMNWESFEEHQGNFEEMIKADEAYFDEGESEAPYK